MKNYFFKSAIFLFLIFSFNTHAQVEEIHLNNPSFEDVARPSHSPRGWYDCGKINFPYETPPDTHPSGGNNPVYGVSQIAYDGNTYVGLIVRENNSYESVSQKLSVPIQGGKCYGFKIAMCKSKIYSSEIRGGKGRKISFTKPIKLRIWGGNGYCGKSDLLIESIPIHNTDWMEYTFKIEPKEDYDFIVFEAYSEEAGVNGHILLDDASSLLLINCDHQGELNFTKKEEVPYLKMEKDENEFLKNNEKFIHDRNEKSLEQAEQLISIAGKSVSFYKDELTESGKNSLHLLANIIKALPNYKLIIDFNGMRKKKATRRIMHVENILFKEGLDINKFEVRNSREDDEQINWLIDNDDMYIGILKIKD